MSTLSDVRIIEKIYDHDIKIDPLILEHIQPSSIDLTLSKTIKVPIDTELVFDVTHDTIDYYFKEINVNEFVLEPNSFIIGQINETIGFSKNLHASIQNRNSLIRKGIHVGLSTYINPGYEGKLPIVIKNIGTFRFKLTAGMRICQLVITDVKPKAAVGYNEKHDVKYHKETDIKAHRTSHDKEITEFLKSKAGDTFSNKELSDFLFDRINKASKDISLDLTEEEKKLLGL